MPFTTTGTVRTVIPDGKGPPRVENRTITSGDDGGGGMNFGGFNAKFWGMNINSGGGGGGDGSSSGNRSTASVKPVTQRGCVDGRTSRKDRTDPFAGLGKQSYDEIVNKCQAEGCLFKDSEFPAKESSIFFSRTPPRPFEWKRPEEICSAPQYVTGGASRFGVQQGELCYCWLLAAVASLTCNTQLLNRVIMPEQNFVSNYFGIFRFRFWHHGEWIEVVVDDRLPTYYDKLVFMHSTDKNEFWSAVLEKAYAKLSGSYECLKGGSISGAMEDFTGGVTESVDLKKAPTNLLNIMMKVHGRGSLLGCSIDADPNQLETILSNGLVMYTLPQVSNWWRFGHPRSVARSPWCVCATPGAMRTSGRGPVQTSLKSGNTSLLMRRKPLG
ncbi:hypothetical protein DPMN_074461 [Dreissena polymorpha]|uniref:Calpain catalytic domain-containing protein n=1 Tax=Dreissena polymorpha TaxID=45954 RepID=A0A9D3YHR8_DREPO|nr:hypothetical protein DPMN_074461 [Dreissena polymorpha]